MTNADKYQTKEERIKAFSAFCNTLPTCRVCPHFREEDEFMECKQRWLGVEIDATLKEEIAVVIFKIKNQITSNNVFLKNVFDQYTAGENKALNSVLVLLEKIMESTNDDWNRKGIR